MAQRAETENKIETQTFNNDSREAGKQNGELAESFSHLSGFLTLMKLKANPEIIDYLSNPASVVYREISYAHPDRDADEWRINFGGLHRMVLARLQEKLIANVHEIERNHYQVTNKVIAELEFLLPKYSELIWQSILGELRQVTAAAVRDWEYMVEYAARTDGDTSKDLFVASSKTPLSHKLMRRYGVIEEGWELKCQPGPPNIGEGYLPGRQRRDILFGKELLRVEEAKNKSLRAQFDQFWISMFGGVALIAPMLLMVLHRDRTTVLATTSGSVFLFAIVVARATSASPEVAVGAVAAYAAVLVVFVGSTLPQPAV